MLKALFHSIWRPVRLGSDRTPASDVLPPRDGVKRLRLISLGRSLSQQYLLDLQQEVALEREATCSELIE